jgi:hypothetical protein
MAPRTKKLGLSLIAVSAFYAKGAPGIDPTPIFNILISFLLILPLFRRPSPLIIWGAATSGLLASLLDRSLQFPLFWITMSLMAGHLIDFLLGDKGVPIRKVRLEASKYLLHFAGLFVLALWTVLSVLMTPLEWSFFHPSPYWPAAWLIVLLSFIAALMEPEKTARWLSIGVFAQGLCLSQTLNFFVLIVAIALPLEMISSPKLLAKLVGRVPQILRKGFEPALILVAILVMASSIRHFEPVREFDFAWIQMSDEMKAHESRGFLIIGPGLPFLAQFHRENLVTDDEALVKSTEDDLHQLLDAYMVTDIIVDKNYLTQFWRNWIAEGRPADVANYSVISRAITYKGEALQTQTLKFSALKGLTEIPLEKDSQFVWLKIRKKT